MDGNRIRKIRDKKGISLNKLSKMSGISKSYLSFIERGKQTNPSISVIEKIATALEIEVDELLGDTEKSEKIDYEVLQLAKELTSSDISKENITLFKEFLHILKKTN